jgi:formate hydrogenlyase transcriptional activator
MPFQPVGIETDSVYDRRKPRKGRRRIVTVETPDSMKDPQFIKKKLRELSTLVEMNEKIHSTMDLDRLLQILVEKAVIGVNFERGLIYLVEGDFLRCMAFLDRVKPEQASRIKDWVGFRMDETAVEVLCVQKGIPLYVQNARKDERVSKKFLKITDTKEYCVVPLLGRSAVLGVLTGDKFYSGKPIRPEDIDTLQLFAGHISLAIENAGLFEEKKRFSQELEAKVAERTAELAVANEQLSNLKNRLEEENISLREKIKAGLKRKFIVGKSPAMNEVMDLVRKVGPTSATVILYGETGTGKELVANAIHELGPRKNGPIIKVNCAAIPDDLLESELFGHEKGAFTGAHERRIGMFQLAQNGTIFLDEIGDLSLKTQTKLLRVLQEQEMQPLGAKLPVQVDVRVIAATNKDLKKKIQDKSFRSDLYYRLNVFPIQMPPLRERKQDIPELVEFFLRKYAYLRPARAKLDQAVMEVFLKYSWPGNIRELENIIERLMIIARNDVISAKDLPLELREEPCTPMPVKPLGAAVEDFKREMVAHVLSLAAGKKSKAAEMLGLPRSNFSRLLKQLGMR